MSVAPANNDKAVGKIPATIVTGFRLGLTFAHPVHPSRRDAFGVRSAHRSVTRGHDPFDSDRLRGRR